MKYGPALSDPACRDELYKMLITARYYINSPITDKVRASLHQDFLISQSEYIGITVNCDFTHKILTRSDLLHSIGINSTFNWLRPKIFFYFLFFFFSNQIGISRLMIDLRLLFSSVQFCWELGTGPDQWCQSVVLSLISHVTGADWDLLLTSLTPWHLQLLPTENRVVRHNMEICKHKMG